MGLFICWFKHVLGYSQYVNRCYMQVYFAVFQRCLILACALHTHLILICHCFSNGQTFSSFGAAKHIVLYFRGTILAAPVFIMLKTTLLTSISGSVGLKSASS